MAMECKKKLDSKGLCQDLLVQTKHMNEITFALYLKKTIGALCNNILFDKIELKLFRFMFYDLQHSGSHRETASFPDMEGS